MIARLNCHLLPGPNFTLCKAGKAERRSSSPEVPGREGYCHIRKTLSLLLDKYAPLRTKSVANRKRALV